MPRYPVSELGAEILAQGFLLRRNILTYKAPERNRGYDLLCTHPNAEKAGKILTIQVKSTRTTGDHVFYIKASSLSQFHYLIAVLLNVRPKPAAPIFYVLKPEEIAPLIQGSTHGDGIYIRKGQFEEFRDELGFERIAKELGVEPLL
jgi:hypothetical protein